MSILNELKKLTGKTAATVVSDALPDNFSGNVCELHVNGGTIQNDISDQWFFDTDFVLSAIDSLSNSLWRANSTLKRANSDREGHRTGYTLFFVNIDTALSHMLVYRVIISASSGTYECVRYDYTLSAESSSSPK